MGIEKSESSSLRDLREFVAELHQYPKEMYAESILAIREALETGHELRLELVTKPETLKSIVSNLLGFFQVQADSIVNSADVPHCQSAELDDRIKLMWSTWPVMNCMLAMLEEVDLDGYSDKAAEMYGILSQALESPHATEILKAKFSEVFPLPKGLS